MSNDLRTAHENQDEIVSTVQPEKSNARLRARSRLRRIGLAILAPLCAFSVYVGTVDTLTANSLIPRLTGVGFVMAAGIMLAAVWGLLSGTERGLSLALVASGLGALLGGFILVVQLSGYDVDWRLGIWANMAVLPAAYAVLLWRTGVRRTVPKRLQATLSITAMLAVAQFWYTNVYLPVTIHSMSVQARLEKQGQEIAPASAGGQPLVPLLATVVVKNETRVRQRFTGSMIGLYGAKVHPRPSIRDDASFEHDLAEAAVHPDRTSRIAKVDDLEMVAAEPFFLPPGDNFLETGHEDIRSFVFHVPKDTYHYVVLVAEITAANAKSVQVGREATLKPRRGLWGTRNAVLQTWRIREQSLLGRITRRPRYLHVNFVYGEQWKGSNVRYYVDRTSRSRSREELLRDPFIPRMDVFYGLTRAQARAELPL